MGKLLQVSAAAIAAYGVYQVVKLVSMLVHDEFFSPLRNLPGPPNENWTRGNAVKGSSVEVCASFEKWVKEYGPTLQYRISYGGRRLYTTDTKALKHILMTTNVYQKPEDTRKLISRVHGDGLINTEGEKHKQQLRDKWSAEIAKHNGDARVDAFSWINRATIDVIGLAGFNYNFDALGEASEMNELRAAFGVLMSAFQTSPVSRLDPITYLRSFGFLKTDKDKKIDQARATMVRISRELVENSKRMANEKEASNRDLLGVLVKSNMSTDIPDHLRMSDEDVLAQISTFLIAGNAKCSTTGSWALYALTQDKAIQSRLREELFTLDTESPTMEQLNTLPYLDMVVRETLRLYCPVPSTIRMAIKDDVLPLGQPITDTNGKVHDSIQIHKGQKLAIPILAINRDTSIWGEDAGIYRPERWEHIPEVAASVPGVWGNMLSFIGGPRACIGYRFSIVELKAFLFVFVRAFEFDLAVPAKDIIVTPVMQRPLLATNPAAGSQLPLLIRHVVQS
ncbi:hypothetical protein H0H93_009047 [Arthromyces matolae]|nr:hypothetical protein H0H93_009047 [Arthromyces matolae]